MGAWVSKYPEEKKELPGDSDGGPFKRGTEIQENTTIKEEDTVHKKKKKKIHNQANGLNQPRKDRASIRGALNLNFLFIKEKAISG